MFYASAGAEEDTAVGRGTRRRKIAGFLRTANELRQSYLESYLHHEEADTEENSIPGSFPNLKVSRNGTEEMVLFPSYARPHVRKTGNVPRPDVAGGDDLHRDPGDAEFWRREWEIHEDANAIVDVDVRGWIYTPARGALTRKNRLLMGVARKISGIPAPGENQSESRSSSLTRGQPKSHEEEVAEREALEIAARGEHEAEIAGRGGYSEEPGMNRGRDSTVVPKPGDLAQPMTDSPLGESELGSLSARSSWTKPSEMSAEELAVANRHLITRLKPFMTTPAAGMAITIFFYNVTTSQSRSTRTNESGHFNFRAALDFIPTSIRVLASENLSASEEVAIVESQGVSVISDIDDTIKHSAISEGAREIFRNAFIRNLTDLTITGVNEWYWSMTRLGAKIHYVSNSPWQMYPILNSYFHEASLPPGSYHLKQYAGMLQGIFEPVAERKRGTIDRLFADFPERKFILIGDSGEADLEVYTETALMYPGRVLGIFIRDVTTEPKKAFFDSSMPATLTKGSRSSPKLSAQDGKKPPPPLPPRRVQQVAEEEPPDLGDLIDFSEDSDPEILTRTSSAPPEEHSGLGLPAPLRPAPPSKPLALRSKSTEDPASVEKPTSDTLVPKALGVMRKPVPAPPPKPRRLDTSAEESNAIPRSETPNSTKQAPPPPLPRRSGNSTPSNLSSNTSANAPNPSNNSNSTSAEPPTPPPRASATAPDQPPSDSNMPPLPPRRPHGTYTGAALQYASQKMWGAQQTGTSAETPQEKRIELWNRRWERAQAALKPKGIIVRTWRVGSDAQKIAEDLIRDAQTEYLEKKGRQVGGVERRESEVRPYALRRV